MNNSKKVKQARSSHPAYWTQPDRRYDDSRNRCYVLEPSKCQFRNRIKRTKGQRGGISDFVDRTIVLAQGGALTSMAGHLMSGAENWPSRGRRNFAARRETLLRYGTRQMILVSEANQPWYRPGITRNSPGPGFWERGAPLSNKSSVRYVERHVHARGIPWLQRSRKRGLRSLSIRSIYTGGWRA
jgi:hypothetical protein